jgi:Putative restriction endonuclease
VNGEVYAMTGGSVNHGEIAMNIGIMLGNHLEDSGCRVLTSDVKVNIQESNDYVYPDVSVTCDERDRRATKFIAHPCLIVEVLFCLPVQKLAILRWRRFANVGKSLTYTDVPIVYKIMFWSILIKLRSRSIVKTIAVNGKLLDAEREIWWS